MPYLSLLQCLANSLGHHLCKCQLMCRPVPRAPNSLMWRQVSLPTTLLPSKEACRPVARLTHHTVCLLSTFNIGHCVAKFLGLHFCKVVSQRFEQFLGFHFALCVFKCLILYYLLFLAALDHWLGLHIY